MGENGGWIRGWKGLAMVEIGEVQNAKNASVESELQVLEELAKFVNRPPGLFTTTMPA